MVEVASTSILIRSFVATSSFVVSITAGVAAVSLHVSVLSIVNLVESISTVSVTFAICISVVHVVHAVRTRACTLTRFIPFRA